ncbi:Mannose-6-phosphate isomerase [Balamuthia mandrillaris]
MEGNASSQEELAKGEEAKGAWEDLQTALRLQGGILFLAPAFVGRESYCGRDVIAPNSDRSKHGDERGYVPVERWVASATKACNQLPKPDEGLSSLLLPSGRSMLLSSAISLEESKRRGDGGGGGGVLFGGYTSRWPLIKVLDIGGKPVCPSFASATEKNGEEEGKKMEVPPIPVHVHAGTYDPKEGRLVGPGKLEAYFFPPVKSVPPYCHRFEEKKEDWGRVVSRLGLVEGTTKEQLVAAVGRFALDDSLYALCNEYEIKEYEGWIIRPKVLHSPGPYPTIEMQLPQDDFNFLGWELGCPIGHAHSEEEDGQEVDEGSKRRWQEARENLLLRGMKDERQVVELAVDWERCTDPHFEQTNKRKSQLLQSGAWGRLLRIFFDEFDGEVVELNAGASFTHHHHHRRCGEEGERREQQPCAGLVWSGRGAVNGHAVDAMETIRQEFVVSVQVEALHVVNTSTTQPLIFFLFFPFELSDEL